MKRILAIIILTFALMQVSTLSAFAQSIKIHKTWLEHNVTNNGVSNLVVHVYLSANNLQGQNISVTAFVDDTPGVGHNDTNGKYKNSQGKVVVSTNVNATYKSSEWKDLKLYLPNSEIHPFSGKHDYYIRVFAFGPNNLRTNGEYVKFSMTGTSGSSAQNQQAKKQNSNSGAQNSGGGTYRRNDRGNSYEVCTPVKNGLHVERYIKCTSCDGSGRKRCTMYHDMELPCVICGNTGYQKCSCDNGWYKVGNWVESQGSIYDKASYVKKWASKQKRGGKIEGVTYKDNGGYYYNCVIFYTDGTHITTSCKQCTTCQNGTCVVCKGVGFRYLYSNPIPMICTSCNGSRKCCFCEGTRCLFTYSYTDRWGTIVTIMGNTFKVHNPDDGEVKKKEPKSAADCPKISHSQMLGGCDGGGRFECTTCALQTIMFSEQRGGIHRCYNCGVEHTYYDPKSSAGGGTNGHYCRCNSGYHQRR